MEIKVDFTGYVYNAAESEQDKTVFSKGEDMILVYNKKFDDYCEIFKIRKENGKLVDMKAICFVYDISEIFDYVEISPDLYTINIKQGEFIANSISF